MGATSKGAKMTKLFRINSKEDLRKVAANLNVRDDWHEPDEQEVTAEVFGKTFDNAGFWGFDMAQVDEFPGEMYVVLFKDGFAVAEVNLATLFSIAAQ
jgi:hypothetical protein